MSTPIVGKNVVKTPKTNFNTIDWAAIIEFDRKMKDSLYRDILNKMDSKNQKWSNPKQPQKG